MTLPKINYKLRCQACRNDKLERRCLLRSSPDTRGNSWRSHTGCMENGEEKKIQAALIRCYIAGIWHRVLILTSSNEHLCAEAEAEHNRARSEMLFLIYFTYTCSDIHIISCCDTLTPDSGRLMQTIHANLHSYHARMGRAGRQRSSHWPKRANTRAKNMLWLNKKNSLKGFSHPQKLMMPPQHSCYATYSRVADSPGSPQRRFKVTDGSQMAAKPSGKEKKQMRTCATRVRGKKMFVWHILVGRALSFISMAVGLWHNKGIS